MIITPLKHAADKNCNFGATITGLDLNNISEEDLEALKVAIHKYQLVMIKDQHKLDPEKHWELVSRLDPTAPQVHGHGTVKEFQKTGGMLSVSSTVQRSSRIGWLRHLRKWQFLEYPLLQM
jgi:xanthine dioxygenase